MADGFDASLGRDQRSGVDFASEVPAARLDQRAAAFEVLRTFEERGSTCNRVLLFQEAGQNCFDGRIARIITDY